jgi:hypothetical protein
MSMDYDYQAEAKAAMRMAAAAISETERLKLVRVALAWQDLARGHEDRLSASPKTTAPIYLTAGARPALRSVSEPTEKRRQGLGINDGLGGFTPLMM